MRPLAPPLPGGERVCAAGHAAGVCPVCGASFRMGARVCRRCQARLETERPALRSFVAGPELLTLPGSFRRPPLCGAGVVVAVESSGHVVSLAPVPGAHLQVVAELPAAAAASRSALVRVDRLGEMLPRAHGAAVLLAAQAAGVDAVLLATGAVLPIYRPAEGEALATNDPADSTGFAAVAASGTHCAVAEHAGAGGVALVVLDLRQKGTARRVLELPGERVSGPIMVCTEAGATVALATESTVGVYSLPDERSAVLELPRGIRALVAREAGPLGITPGTVPLTAGTHGDALRVQLAAVRDGLMGLLTLGTDAAPAWEPLGRGASLTGNPDGTLTLAANDEVRVLDGASRLWGRARLQFGMPAALLRGSLVCFAEESHRGLHRLEFWEEGGGSPPQQLLWEDALCDELACAAPMLAGSRLVVPYSVEEAGNFGVRLAVWLGSPKG